MTSVTFWMGVNLGNCVQQMDIWQETLNGIGRWQIIADPAAGCSWPAVNTITALRNNHVELSINGVLLMRGYVDDVLPYVDTEGYHTRLYRITGRSRGMDLAQHQVSGQWVNTRADLIIAAALGIIPSELTLAVVGPNPGNIDYEADRTYLSDLVRDVANLVNYDFYVDNTNWPANANLNFFGPGASATAVTLIDFPNSLLNNLWIDPAGEEVGFNIKNFIDAHAGGLEDHYTDLNAVDWVGFNAAITDDFVLFLNGKGAIRATNNSGGAAIIGATLTVNNPTYSYTTMNLSEPTMGSYNYLIHDTSGVGIKRVRLRLTDNGGRTIEFYRSNTLGLAKCKNCTDIPTIDEWRKVNVHLGDEAGILPALVAQQEGNWYEFNFVSPPPFDWANVVDIAFFTTGHPVGVDDGDYFVVDGLEFPNLEVRAIRQDAASIANYGQRMKDYFRPDIKNQYELNDYSAAQLRRLKDPKETLKGIAIGQTGTPFAAQTLDVVAPQFGIGGPGIGATIVYRILRLHHKVVKNSESSDKPGYTFTTEYELIRNVYFGTATTQYVDHTQIINTVDPTESILRDTRLTERYRRRSGSPRLMP